MVVVDDRGKQRTLIVPREAEALYSLDYLAAVCTRDDERKRNWSNDSYTEGEVP